MAQGWEPVRTRESFELETPSPPSRRRQRRLPRKRFIITGGVLLLLLVLYFTSSNTRRKDNLSQDQTTFEDPSAIDLPPTPEPDITKIPEPDIPQIPEPDIPQTPEPDVPPVSPVPPVPTVPTADVDNSAPPSPTDDISAEPSLDTLPPVPSSDVVELEPVKPASPPVSIYTAPPPQPTNPLSTIKAAVIIESRPLPNLIPIILHFSSILGSDWPIHIFTDGSNSKLFPTSPAFQRGVRDGRLRVRSLPLGTTLTTQAALSGFLTKPWLWEKMAPAEHVLIFQTDSMLCANSPHKVEFFFEYDFVGAPINSERTLGMSYNGGLSLRNRTLSLEITQEFDWQAEQNRDYSKGDPDYEDQWFSQKMSDMGANLPTTEVAMEFSVETMWFDKPLGYHQPFVWQQDRMTEIEEWCPEIKMCTTETFTET